MVVERAQFHVTTDLEEKLFIQTSLTLLQIDLVPHPARQQELCNIPMIRICETYIEFHSSSIDNIGIPKHKNTYDLLVQVRNFLLPLS